MYMCFFFKNALDFLGILLAVDFSCNAICSSQLDLSLYLMEF